MRIGAIVQARMSSTRLPGKTLAPIQGKPMLQYLLERLTRARQLDCLLVATSSGTSDDPIAAFCQSVDVPCFRGELAHVANRFGCAMQAYALDGCVRICGDSPLLDPALVDAVVALFRRERPDLATNCLVRTYPPGQSVEVVDAATFLAALPAMTDAQDQEHVTRFFKDSGRAYRVCQLVAPRAYADIHLTVDQPEDLALLRRVIGTMTRPHYAYDLDAVVALYRELATPAKR